jgi:predicted MFS family arabinose efflux permease
MPALLVLALGCFAGALSFRVIDPMVPEVARDLGTLPATVALLASAFAFPYAIGQPLLGSIGDALGKVRIIKICTAVLALMLAASALAPTIETLFVARILAGLAAGGIIPLAIAMVGDRVALDQRQVALSQLLMALLMAQIVGVIGSGIIGSLLGWRMAVALTAAAALAGYVLMALFLKPRPNMERPPLTMQGMKSGYAQVFRNPRAKVCYVAVLVEGIAVFGLLPYIAVILEARGTGGIREAGFVLSGMGIGGILYALTVGHLLSILGGQGNLIRIGGLVTALGLACVASATKWQLDMAAFVIIGYGFYMIHNSLQTQATELAPGARGAAVALHAFFFFLGHAIGPVLYGSGLASLGIVTTILAGGVLMAVLGFLVARALSLSSA